MNGTIQVKSKINKGTEFIITLSFKTSNIQLDSENTNIEINADSLTDKMILLADDNEENRILAKEIILSKNQKVKIIEASDGNEVVSLLFKKIPDILFIDLDMPNLNGIETTQHIRKNKKYNKIKIIRNTASLNTFSLEEIKEFGFDDFKLKPYKPMHLIKKLCE